MGGRGPLARGHPCLRDPKTWLTGPYWGAGAGWESGGCSRWPPQAHTPSCGLCPRPQALVPRGLGLPCQASPAWPDSRAPRRTRGGPVEEGERGASLGCISDRAGSPFPSHHRSSARPSPSAPPPWPGESVPPADPPMHGSVPDRGGRPSRFPTGVRAGPLGELTQKARCPSRHSLRQRTGRVSGYPAAGGAGSGPADQPSLPSPWPPTVFLPLFCLSPRTTRSHLWKPTTLPLRGTRWPRRAWQHARGQTPPTPWHQTRGQLRRPFCSRGCDRQPQPSAAGRRGPSGAPELCWWPASGPGLGRPSLTGWWWRLSAVAAPAPACAEALGWGRAPGTVPALKDVCGRGGGGDGPGPAGRHGPPHTARQAHTAWQVAAVPHARVAGEAAGRQTKVPARPPWWAWTFPWQPRLRCWQNGLSRDREG